MLRREAGTRAIFVRLANLTLPLSAKTVAKDSLILMEALSFLIILKKVDSKPLRKRDRQEAGAANPQEITLKNLLTILAISPPAKPQPRLTSTGLSMCLEILI